MHVFLYPITRWKLCGSFLQGIYIALLVAVTSVTAAQADYINTNGAESAPNFAELRILDDRVRVGLEIDPKDYKKFFAPEDDAGATGAPRTFQVLAEDTPLAPQITGIEIRPRTERPVPARPAGLPPAPTFGPLSTDVVYMEIEYPFSGKPQELTFVPPLDDKGKVVALIGFLSWHQDIVVNDYRFLSAPEKLTLDWDDPWYSAYSNTVLRRHNYAPVSSFLTMTPRETRHEVIFRLADLETWTDLGLGEQKTLSAETLDQIKAEAAQLFATSNTLSIDGEPVMPTDVRIVPLSLDVNGWSIREADIETPRASALFGAILSYPLPDLPDEVEVNWNLFSARGSMIPVLETDPVGSALDAVTMEGPVVVWKNALKQWVNPKATVIPAGEHVGVSLPLLAIFLVLMGAVFAFLALRSHAGRRGVWTFAALAALTCAYPAKSVTHSVQLPRSAPMDKEIAEQVAEKIIRNLGTSQLEVLPAQFAASLTPYVTAEATIPVGSELRRGLSVSLPTGAVAQVDEIDRIRVEEVAADGATHQILVRWSAYLSGGHWGHQHRRAIDYRALMDVVASDGQWMVSGLTIIEAKSPTIEPDTESSS